MKTTRTKHRLQLATPSDREIVMTRTFDASCDAVFDAFVTPESIARWLLGPDGWTMPVCEVDLRAGGTFRYVWRNDAEDREFGVTGSYREIERPRRIVRTERFDDPSMPGETLITTTFAPQTGTTIVTMTIAYESAAHRDGALESGMQGGVAASYDRLAGLLV